MATPVAKNPIEMGTPRKCLVPSGGRMTVITAYKKPYNHGNYTSIKMGEGFVKNPDAVTPAMEEAAAAETVTVTDMDGNPVEPTPCIRTTR